MDAIEVANFAACDYARSGPPLSLVGVRRAWPDPPARMFIWAEVFNPSQQDFYWSIELFRGKQLIYETEQVLEIQSERYVNLLPELVSVGLERKVYSLVFLLNDVEARRMKLDFGHPEATP